MPWDDLVGHASAIDRFRRSVERNRLASTYLFVGPEGVGKHAFALKLAQALLCETNPAERLEACGVCPACQQVAARTHPDLILIDKPKDKAFIPVETFIGDREHRRQRGLCHDIGLKPFRGGRKIAIINDADFLNQEGANCLLKTLEEPPPKSLLILVGTSEQRQLSTIVSRSQIVRFAGLETSEVEQLLGRLSSVETDVAASELAAASGGSVATAVRLSETETFEFRQQLLTFLAQPDPAYNEFTKTITTFVDAAGKDAASKRARLTMVADVAIDFYRQCFLAVTGEANPELDQAMSSSVDRLVSSWSDRDDNVAAESLGLCIHRCGDLQQQVTANVNQGVSVEAWLRDLSRLTR